MKPGKLVTVSIIFLSVAILPMPDVDAKVLAKGSANNGPVLPDSIRAEVLLKRLEEIKTMDFSSMSPSEKKKFKKEVRSITKEVREINGRGVYISIAGLIIIALLLVLLL
jgi:hypothetical protein